MLPNYRLIHAIKNGSLDDMNQAIACGASLDARDFDGSSLLQVAENRHQNDIARKLIDTGANMQETVGKNADTLLHRAASKGNLGFAVVLTEHGLSPNIVNRRGLTPLYVAVQNGHEYLVRYLLEHRADPNFSTDPQGNSSLHLAARRGDTALIRILVSHGASLTGRNHRHYTPLHEAAAAGNADAAKLLLGLVTRAECSEDMNFPHPPAWIAQHNGHTDTASVIVAEAPSSFAQRIQETKFPHVGPKR